MAIKQRYKDNIFYLYLVKNRSVSGAPIDFVEEPIMFEGNISQVTKSHFSPQNNTYIPTTSTVIKTDSQRINAITKYARITKARIPINDATQRDFSIVDNIVSKPLNSKGERYRTVSYKTWEITIV